MLVTVQQLLKLSWAALEILVTSFPVPDFRIARNNFTVLSANVFSNAWLQKFADALNFPSWRQKRGLRRLSVIFPKLIHYLHRTSAQDNCS